MNQRDDTLQTALLLFLLFLLAYLTATKCGGTDAH